VVGRLIEKEQRGPAVGLTLGLYKIFVYFKAFVHERILVFLPLAVCIAHNNAFSLHNFCATSQPLFCMPPTIHNWY